MSEAQERGTIGVRADKKTTTDTDAQLIAPGRRPENRRELLLEAAAALFHRSGYESVGMAAVGRLAGVGASAIYRHFPSKQELLAGVLRREVGAFADALSVSADGSVDDTLRALAEVTVPHYRAAALWRREGRFLAPDARASVQEELGTAMKRLVDVIGQARPGTRRPDPVWVAHAVLSVLGHAPPAELRDSPAEHTAFVETVLRRVVGMPEPVPVRTQEWPETEGSRRDAIRRAATTLIAERGYAAVTMGDIADAIGIAGPSLYHHFPSKQAILDEILRHSIHLMEFLRLTQDGIGCAVERYALLATRSTDLLDLLRLELAAASGGQRSRFVAARDDLVATWVAGLPPSTAHPRPLVDVALQTVADVAMASRRAGIEDAADGAAAVGRAVLGLMDPRDPELPARSPE